MSENTFVKMTSIFDTTHTMSVKMVWVVYFLIFNVQQNHDICFSIVKYSLSSVSEANLSFSETASVL